MKCLLVLCLILVQIIFIHLDSATTAVRLALYDVIILSIPLKTMIYVALTCSILDSLLPSFDTFCNIFQSSINVHIFFFCTYLSQMSCLSWDASLNTTSVIAPWEVPLYSTFHHFIVHNHSVPHLTLNKYCSWHIIIWLVFFLETNEDVHISSSWCKTNPLNVS